MLKISNENYEQAVLNLGIKNHLQAQENPNWAWCQNTAQLLENDDLNQL